MTEAENSPNYYVGIGASAGGLEAIESFFTNMPGDTGLAFIVVQHLSPDYKSLMKELLSKKTPMEVLRAEDGMTVQANSVYLIPPKKNMTIYHGKLLLQDQDIENRSINLPIDIFLTSLGEDVLEKAIAIILSGTGSDGMRGVSRIKEMGGLVMVQTEESAKFDGMPKRAISTGIADYILPPEDMPQELISFIEHPYMSKDRKGDKIFKEEDDISKVFSILRDKTKVDFSNYKPNTIIRRIERRMSVCQLKSLFEYVNHLEKDPLEVQILYKDLLIGVTSFFRDPESFEELKIHLDSLISNIDKEEIRIWVSGCSSGEEAYSIAIFMEELIEKNNLPLKYKIFATDIDRDALMYASNGIYPESIGADINPDLLQKYFTPSEDNFQISREIREQIVFAQHNLMKDPPFTNLDLISCRNLLIYLQSDAQKIVFNSFNFSLNRGGLLFLGSSESIGEMHDYFATLSAKHKIFHSVGRKRLETVHEAPSVSTHELRTRNYDLSNRASFIKSSHDERVLERFLQKTSENYIPMSAIVNENMEILHVFGDKMKKYFSVPVGKMSNNISKMAIKELSIPLSTGIQKVLSEGIDVKFSNIRADIHGEIHKLDLRITLLPEKKGQETLLAVFIEKEESSQNSEENSLQLSYDIDKEAQQRIHDLEQELQFTKESLQATIEELETSNEELQATNEELLASNEELQSTNEELQSVNEELFTVNAEHQSKITELTELNNDLNNLMAVFPIATIFLDDHLRLRRFTGSVEKIFPMRQPDLGRSIQEISNKLEDTSFIEDLLEVHKKHEIKIRHVRTIENKWYQMQINPYEIAPSSYSGSVISFSDITELKNYQMEMEQYRDRFNLSQEAAQLGFWDWDIENNKLYWSMNTEKIFGIEPGSFKGNYEDFKEFIHKDDLSYVDEKVNRSLWNKENYKNVVHRIIRPDGSQRWLSESGSVHLNHQSRPVRMLGMVQDITEIKILEANIFEKQQWIGYMMDLSSDILVIINHDQTVNHINRKGCEILGYKQEEIIGENWFDKFIPQEKRDEVRKFFIKFMNNGIKPEKDFQNCILNRNGDVVPVQWHNFPLNNEFGRPVASISSGSIKIEDECGS